MTTLKIIYSMATCLILVVAIIKNNWKVNPYFLSVNLLIFIITELLFVCMNGSSIIVLICKLVFFYIWGVIVLLLLVAIKHIPELLLWLLTLVYYIGAGLNFYYSW